MNNARSILEPHATKSTEGDIADWLACVCKRDGEHAGAFRKTLDNLLGG